MNTMKVIKRGNRGSENVKFDKITVRLANLSKDLPSVSPEIIAQKVIKNIYDGIHVEELDIISANVADNMRLVHPEYGVLAGRILVSNLHKTTPESFVECMTILDTHLDLISKEKLQFAQKHCDRINQMIDHRRDYLFGFNAIKTLEKQFLHKINDTKTVCDRPQYMYMRVAIEVVYNRVYLGNDEYGNNNLISNEKSINRKLTEIKYYYDQLSTHKFTFATPTNFNSFTNNPQLNSCFLLSTDDSIEEIMRTITNSALISKRAGGIGIAMHKIRAEGSIIKGTNGVSDGVFPQLKIYDANVLCWNQGGGKRKGAVAIYMNLCCADIMKVLTAKLSQGSDEIRARNLFYAVWVEDLFMRRLINGDKWSLFSDDTAPGLSDVFDGMNVCSECGYCENKNYLNLISRNVLKWSDIAISNEESPIRREDSEVKVPKQPLGTFHCAANKHNFTPINVFTNLYTRYEREGRARNVVDPALIENAICESQRESGGPYVCFKDHANRQTNQKNIGTLTSSNLCAEIYEWHDKDSYACCSLASIALPKFVSNDGMSDPPKFDFDALGETVRGIVRGLDNNVTMNDYPVRECSKNALDFRPIAIGVQGLADVFMEMDLPFLSEESTKLDLQIFETIYYNALSESSALAAEYGSYAGFNTSPISKGKLRFDLWEENQQYLELLTGKRLSHDYNSRYTTADWNDLRGRVSKGLRNSLTVALMPTVTTSHILGNNEAFEPIPSNVYTKNTLAGKLTVVNDRLIYDLIKLGIYDESMKNNIINSNGSIANIGAIPEHLREKYKTVWEMKQSDLMRRASLRQAFIDQGQSLNIHTTVNTDARLRGIFRAGWSYGLNTGSYYIRTKPTVEPLKNNIAESKKSKQTKSAQSSMVSTDAVCEIGCNSCGS